MAECLTRLRGVANPTLFLSPRFLAAAVLTLACFNLTFRLGRERLTEWDEGLYAETAFEMLQNDEWIATTSGGRLDYSNSKPPLNVWLMALSMKSFGISLVSIRVASVIAALLTVLVLLLWTWRRFGPRVSVLSALVLSTTFGFLYVHSGRSGNPDALLTLFMLLIVVVLDGASARPSLRIWLGPLLAGVFLLKGMAVLLPLLLVAFMESRWRLDLRRRWLPLLGAFAIGGIPVAAWTIARWQVDQWTFFRLIFFQDFVALAATPLDNQSGTPLFYLNILQKHHHEWLVAILLALILFPPAWSRVKTSLMFWRNDNDRQALIGAWSVIAIAVPTLMQTKMPWYLNPFYPMFALGAGWILSRAIAEARNAIGRRPKILVAVIAGALVVAELKLIYYSYTQRALATSAQGLVLHEVERLRGATVYRTSWNHADAFVLTAMVGARPARSSGIDDFALNGKAGDYFLASRNSLASQPINRCDFVQVADAGRFVLLEKVSPTPKVGCRRTSHDRESRDQSRPRLPKRRAPLRRC
jgi:4-amino-4-deoxy-L-arabinose transferase-like glycosyltransferase